MTAEHLASTQPCQKCILLWKIALVLSQSHVFRTSFICICLCSSFVCWHGKLFVLKAIWAVHTIPAVSSSDVKSVWRRVWTLYTLRFFCQKEKKEKDMWRHGRLLITQFISPKVQKKKIHDAIQFKPSGLQSNHLYPHISVFSTLFSVCFLSY